jgi:predicted dehydrogenase
MASPAKIGVVGCGTISGIYLRNCAKFENLEVVACADRHLDRAEAKARRHGIPRFCTVEELLDDPQVEIVLNLTQPASHAQVALAALDHGKSVYNEKPLAVERDDGRRILETAERKGLLVGSAPDTFLGGGLQTCRKLIDEGAIGSAVAASAFVFHPRPESWHPSPDFFYQHGAGPLFDVGPYFLTALVALLGPVSRLVSSARITFPERLITSQPRHGETVKVETPTHVAGIMDFENGAVATLVTSFDVWAGEVPHIEIYGSEGTLSLPDPNTFDGPVRLYAAGVGAASGWTEVPLSYGYTRNSRGVGLSDMASALRTGLGTAPRASGALAYHVLDVMHAFLEASQGGRRIELTSGVPRPEPMPSGIGDPRFSDAAYAGRLSIESRIEDLLASERGRATLERHLPGFANYPLLQMLQHIPLVELADYDTSTFTDEVLVSLAADFAGDNDNRTQALDD